MSQREPQGPRDRLPDTGTPSSPDCSCVPPGTRHDHTGVAAPHGDQSRAHRCAGHGSPAGDRHASRRPRGARVGDARRWRGTGRPTCPDQADVQRTGGTGRRRDPAVRRDRHRRRTRPAGAGPAAGTAVRDGHDHGGGEHSESTGKDSEAASAETMSAEATHCSIDHEGLVGASARRCSSFRPRATLRPSGAPVPASVSCAPPTPARSAAGRTACQAGPSGPFAKSLSS